MATLMESVSPLLKYSIELQNLIPILFGNCGNDINKTEASHGLETEVVFVFKGAQLVWELVMAVAFLIPFFLLAIRCSLSMWIPGALKIEQVSTRRPILVKKRQR